MDNKITGKALRLLVVMDEGVELHTRTVRSFLMSKLENYKVPAQYEQVESIARTYNGKLDRKAYANYGRQ